MPGQLGERAPPTALSLPKLDTPSNAVMPSASDAVVMNSGVIIGGVVAVVLLLSIA